MNNKTLTLKMKRAISELRSGGKVVISDNSFGTSVLLMSAELIEKESVNKLSDIALSRPNIILSNNRCNAIGIEVSNQPCSILIENNCETIYWKTGHSHIKRKVHNEKALAGFEKSGHFFFNQPLGYGYDDGINSAIQVDQSVDNMQLSLF